MSQSFLGDGLIFEELLPLAWSSGPLVQGVALARLNADNQQLLGAEASLEEVRMHDVLKDESAALVHELQRLEYKLNILLRLVADVATRQHPLPAPRPVKFSSAALEWLGDDPPPGGSTGMLMLYVNPSLPQPLRIPAIVSAASHNADGGVLLQFTGLSEAVVELIEKMIFRHHRRLVAGARVAPARNP